MAQQLDGRESIHIDLPADAVQIVLRGLGKLPLEVAAPVYNSIHERLKQQLLQNGAETAEGGS